MLSVTHYAQNYAGIIGRSLSQCTIGVSPKLVQPWLNSHFPDRFTLAIMGNPTLYCNNDVLIKVYIMTKSLLAKCCT